MEEDLGEPLNSTEVEEKMVDAWGSLEFDEVKLKDFAYVEKSIKVSSDAHVVLSTGTLVSKIEDGYLSDGTPARQLTLTIEAVETPDPKLPPQKSVREKPLTYRRPTAESSQLMYNQIRKAQGLRAEKVNNEIHVMDTENEVQTTSFEMYASLVGLCSIKKVQCFQFKLTKANEPPPEAVKQDPNCRGLPECQWPVTTIQFVAVLSETDPKTGVESKSKSIIRMKLQQDVPFLSKLIQYCYEGISTYQGQKFPVSICYDLKDFRKGTP